ncbi:hypothetical protein M438DRAFT_134981 [Aureobasidium pullulans EXF-150]|uniref:Uncharacterized protein n=1 Tax=Aureobasidium pullulans EXF-150 TaxID=1043002 RepID=A0A074YLZ5_AURPU|nr:uncharacterized protein M438DRAFT_134981 [Aureobasidium pullulans EXF-150]KEQ87921.1 hypothetical protein M438DRAFT_134981 [Aureobasidium pullulans EXF-150]
MSSACKNDPLRRGPKISILLLSIISLTCLCPTQLYPLLSLTISHRHTPQGTGHLPLLNLLLLPKQMGLLAAGPSEVSNLNSPSVFSLGITIALAAFLTLTTA